MSESIAASIQAKNPLHQQKLDEFVAFIDNSIPSAANDITKIDELDTEILGYAKWFMENNYRDKNKNPIDVAHIEEIAWKTLNNVIGRATTTGEPIVHAVENEQPYAKILQFRAIFRRADDCLRKNDYEFDSPLNFAKESIIPNNIPLTYLQDIEARNAHNSVTDNDIMIYLNELAVEQDIYALIAQTSELIRVSHAHANDTPIADGCGMFVPKEKHIQDEFNLAARIVGMINDKKGPQWNDKAKKLKDILIQIRDDQYENTPLERSYDTVAKKLDLAEPQALQLIANI